jgi:hypothetical protein
MPPAARTVGDFLQSALRHPEGPGVLRAFDRTFQFELTDGEAFYVEVQDGRLRVEDGDCGLDWRYEDWERVTCVRTSRQVLEDAIAGRRLLSEAFFDRTLGFAPDRAADAHTPAGPVVAWFYTIFRLAREQAEREAYARYVQELGRD